ncbi:MAG: TetR/AcrR family transcriptional regulator [Tetrasphaera sp.]
MPRDGGPTRTRILDTAERLAIEHGFTATPVERIIGESGTSKGSFFHHFHSKSDLASALVERYAAADIAHLHRALAAVAPLDGATARLLAFVQYFVAEADELMAAQSSCLYVAALTEQDLIQEGATAPIERAILLWRSAIAGMIRDAAAEQNRPPAGLDADALADHIFVTFEGSFLLCRATGDPGHMRRQLTILHIVIAALFVPAASG